MISLQESQVTVECIIPQKYHRTVMGAKGFKVQEITREYDVGIKFPDRPSEAERKCERLPPVLIVEVVPQAFLGDLP